MQLDATRSASTTAPSTVQDAIDSLGFGRYQRYTFLVCLLAWCADGGAAVQVGFLLNDLKSSDSWGISKLEQSLLGSSIFVGMLIGSMFFGVLADIKGRLPTLVICTVVSVAFALASSWMPSVVGLIAMQLGAGIGVGGSLPLVFSLFSESTPTKGRGFYLTLLAASWSIGELVISGAAWGFMPGDRDGWRWVLRVSALPNVLVLLLMLPGVVQESPRFLAMHGRRDEAAAALAKIAAVNRRVLPDNFKPAAEQATDENGSLKALFAPSLRKQTVLLWAMWFLSSYAYYGLLVYLPAVLDDKGLSAGSVYSTVFITGSGNIPGIVLAAYLVDAWGRKPTMAAFVLAAAVVIFPLAPAASRATVIVLLIVAKFAVYGYWGAIDGYTPECYPTSIRSIGNAAASSMARIAGIVSPFANVYLEDISIWLNVSTWVLCFAATAALALMLPLETKGLVLADTVEAVPPPRSNDETPLLQERPASEQA